MRSYLLQLILMALVLALVLDLCPRGKVRQVLQLAGGLVLVLVAMDPLLQVDTGSILREFQDLEAKGEAYSQQGGDFRSQQLAQGIQAQIETYILDKAAACQAQVQVSVTMAPLGEGYWIPETVTLTGTVTPNQRELLTQVLVQELGLTEEQIRWK